jgi:hypothetical protein
MDLSFALPGQSLLVFEADWHEKLLQEERRGKGCIGNTFQFISIAELLLEECSASESAHDSHSFFFPSQPIIQKSQKYSNPV